MMLGIGIKKRETSVQLLYSFLIASCVFLLPSYRLNGPRNHLNRKPSNVRIEAGVDFPIGKDVEGTVRAQVHLVEFARAHLLEMPMLTFHHFGYQTEPHQARNFTDDFVFAKKKSRGRNIYGIREAR